MSPVEALAAEEVLTVPASLPPAEVHASEPAADDDPDIGADHSDATPEPHPHAGLRLPHVLAAAVGLFVVAGLGFGVVRFLAPRPPAVAQSVRPATNVPVPASTPGPAGNTVPAALTALAIKPAPLAGDHATVALPGPAEVLCVGGGGRYLILHLPGQHQLAVFDSDEAAVVKFLPVADDTPRVAAGLDQLFVALPDGNAIERWSLKTFEKEATAAAPVPVRALAMGSASRGPLVVRTANGPAGRVVCLDPQTLREGDTRIAGRGDVVFAASGDRPADTPLSVSADARVIAGSGIYVRSGNTYNAPAETESVAFAGGAATIVPGPDGRHVYTGGQLFTVRGQPVGSTDTAAGPQHWLVPALHGPYHLSLTRAREPGAPVVASIALAADGRELVRIPDSADLQKDLNSLADKKTGQLQAVDRHLFLSPQAKLLAVLPAGGDRLSLYRVDVDGLLDASSVDYLFVTSEPPAEFQPGTTLAYQVVVRSRKGGVRYKVEAGPPGMYVSTDGLLRWPVPANFAAPDVTVALVVADAGTRETLHRFQVLAPDRPRAATKPAQPQAGAPR